MDNPTPESKQRVFETNVQNFDQLVAVTQDYINDTLYYGFLIANQSGKPTLKVEDQGSSIEAEITPPRVDLIVEKEPQKVFYIVKLSTGTFIYVDRDKKPQEIAIKDWALAFTVNLSLIDAAALPSNLAAKVNIPGRYNVKQLMLDVTTANLQLLDERRTKVPGANLGDPAQKNALQILLKKYVDTLRAGTANIIGYAITVPDPNVANPKAPTFPPTALTVQTCAYRGTSGRDREANAGLNTLVYLEMTNRRPLPADTLREASWVLPPMTGTMAISARNFWEYLVPKLNEVNDQSAVVATGAKCKGLKSSWSWQFGISGDHSFLRAGPSWVFNHEAKKTDTEDDVVAKFSCTAKSSVKNLVSFVPGSNEIVVKGKSTLNLSLKHSVVGVPEKAWGKSWVEWSFSILMTAVTDGGLQFTTTEPKPTSGSDTGGDLLGKLENSLTGDMDKMTAGLRNSLTHKLNVSEWATNLATALSGQKQFVLPGSGDFLFKNPILNAQGDLLIELTYKQ